MSGRPDGREELGDWREVGPARPPTDASAEAEQDEPRGPAPPRNTPQVPERHSGGPAHLQAGRATEHQPRGPARSRQRRGVVGLVLGVLGVVALVAGGRAIWSARTVAGQRAAVVRALEATPGLIVLTTDVRAGVLCIRGLADPAARSPADVAASAVPARALAGLTLEFAPFEAPGAEFAQARLRRRLAPPSGVEVRIDDAGVTRFSGEASAAWIERARAVAPGMLGVVSVDLADLVDVDQRELARLAADLDGLAVRFPLGRADLGGASDLADPRVGAVAARAGIAELGRAAARAGAFVRVELVHVRHTLEGADTELALRRIAVVRALLAQDSGAWLLYEPRSVAPGAPLVAESGAVRLSLQVLGSRPEHGSGGSLGARE